MVCCEGGGEGARNSIDPHCCNRIPHSLQVGPYTISEKNDTKNEKTVLGSQKRVFWTACILIIIVETSTLTIKKESSKSDNFRRKSIGGSLVIFLKIGTKLTNSQQEVSKVSNISKVSKNNNNNNNTAYSESESLIDISKLVFFL